MSQVWVVRSGLQNETVSYFFTTFKKHGLIGTNETVPEDLSHCEDNVKDFKKICYRYLRNFKNKQTAGNEARRLYWFTKEIKPLDIVITPLKAQKKEYNGQELPKDWRIAVVPIDSKYYFLGTDKKEELKPCPYHHYRKVRWEALVNGRNFPQEIQNKIEGQGSVFSIDKGDKGISFDKFLGELKKIFPGEWKKIDTALNEIREGRNSTTKSKKTPNDNNSIITQNTNRVSEKQSEKELTPNSSNTINKVGLLNKPLTEEEDISGKEIEAVIEPRPFQQALRKRMLEYWENSCAVTDIPIEEMLEACHIKPYRDCTHEEKLDPHNGLLLTANLHKLFDAGYISFRPEDGKIIFSAELEKLTPTEHPPAKAGGF